MYDKGIRSTTKTEGFGVEAYGIGKKYGDSWALRDLDLEVPRGTVLGLLGHNGAGKTTTIRILTTLARASEGSARVANLDVVKQAAEVRRNIGVAGQYATVDDLLSARANLEMVARLQHFSRSEARLRAGELLERVGLASEADRLVRTFSGGMRRRVDLAASLLGDPAVLFLDEPTTGLDPQSRNDLWEMVQERVDLGTTVVLTTQYLEEADRVADRIVVLERGRIAASGTSAQLKRDIGNEWIDVTLVDAAQGPAAVQALSRFADGTPLRNADGLVVSTAIASDVRLIDVLRALDGAGIEATDVRRREATLDEVFLTLTQTQQKQKVAA